MTHHAATPRRPQAVREGRRHPAHWLLRGALLGAGLAVLGAVTGKTIDAHISRNDAGPGAEKRLIELQLPTPEAQARWESLSGDEAEPDTASSWQTHTVRSGDSLAAIFDRAGVSPRTLYRVLQLGDEAKRLTRIFPGDELRLQVGQEGRLLALEYHPSPTRTLRIWREGEDYRLENVQHAIERRPVYRSGVIRDSLFQAAQSAGMSETTVMELAEIFGWDIDFALDIREGDRFIVIYDEIYKDGLKLEDGDILAAEFVNDGRRYRAIRYTDPSGESGYFTPEGKNVRKAFLRSPVSFARVSSRFTLKRWHPVLHRWRAHRGVDYAAPTGTPVKASGDGKVSFAGTKGGLGKAVFIQHGSSYTTVYAHLSRYAKGIRAGTRVKQNQVIGYVGATGLATGPHLHYEFRVNGVHRNPLTVKLPDGKPVDPKYWEHFRESTIELARTLEVLDRSFLAVNEY